MLNSITNNQSLSIENNSGCTIESKELRSARLSYLFMVKRYKAPLDLEKIEYFKSMNMNEFHSGLASTDLFNSLLEKYNRKRSTVSAKKDEGGNVDKLNIIIMPKRINRIYKRGNVVPDLIVDNFNSTIGIFYVPAIIHKDGRLEAQENSLPWIPYDFQDPFSRKYCICKYDEKENWLDQSAYKGIDNPQGKNLSWEKYVHEVIEYYKRTTKLSWEDNSLVEFHNPNLEYPTDEELLVCLDETINADFHVMRLYKNILVNEGDLLDEFQYPLFNTMIGAFKDRKRQVAYDDLNIDRMKEHLGTMGNKFPLAVSQRDAIHNICSLPDGNVLAVSGPPGTGKTTLLQSVVADMVVHAALEAKCVNVDGKWKWQNVHAPIIAATSANNKAITNIIDSFSSVCKSEGKKDPWEGRWIDGANSLAVYYPSSTKKTQAKENGYFIDEQYFELNRTKGKSDIKDGFINKAQVALKNDKIYNLSFAAYILHSEIVSCQKDMIDVVDMIGKIMGNHPNDYVRETPLKVYTDEKTRNKLRDKLVDIGNAHDFNLKDNLINIVKDYIKKLLAKLSPDKDVDQYLKETKLIDIISQIRLVDINNLLDVTLRHKMFWLSVHFFEAQWLINFDQKKDKSKSWYIDPQIRAMLTPCVIATFFMLPKVFRHEDEDKPFPYDKIDLLIVDEAGQVSPELALPAFSLAKKALVVGDVCQIPPVWEMQDKGMDLNIAHYTHAFQTKNEDDTDIQKQFDESAYNCSSSSLMKVAHEACAVTKDGKAGGLMLTEHRRCLKEIISFCNELMYEGKLQPMRTDVFVPENFLGANTYPMSRMVCEHSDSTDKDGSRVSVEEAQKICDWLRTNYQYLKNYSCYKAKEGHPFSIVDIVSIITPFKAQTELIKEKLRKVAKDKDFAEFEHLANKGVGTVHTFQGAESKMVIFSTVYGSEESWTFIKDNPNLVNVAVSRAKDYFILCSSTYGNDKNAEDDFGQQQISGNDDKNVEGKDAASLLMKYTKGHIMPDVLEQRTK